MPLNSPESAGASAARRRVTAHYNKDNQAELQPMGRKLKILHLEDLYSDAELINRVLRKAKLDYERVVVETKDKFISALNEFCPDIILSDHSLPSFNSHEALTILHEMGLKIPFILVTAAMSDEFAINVINRGADDYILKDRLERLPIAIHNSLEKFRLERERKMFLDESIKNEKYYRALTENINDAIVLLTVDGVFIYQSPSATRLTGFALGERLDQKFLEYIHPDDLQNSLALFQRVHAQPGIPVLSQYRILHKDGYYIWTEGTITNLLHDESVNAYILNYRDITERKKAEEKLNLSRLYAESIVTTIREPLLILNKDLKVRSANRSFYNKFQTTQESTEGIILFKLGNEQWDIPELRTLLEQMIPESTNIVDFEVAQTLPAVGERIMVLNATRIYSGNDEEQSILLAIEDITEQRKQAMDLRLFAEELEKQVSERTFSLHKVNLELLHSNENLEQFAYVASHDLQEPLRKIRTYSSFLQNNYIDDLPETAKELVTKITNSAERMSTLINQLLNFSVMLHGEAAFEDVDLNDIITNVIKDFELLIIEKHAVIRCERLPVIEAIPLQMNQLFYNLTSNCLKFSKKGTPPEIMITSRTLSKEEVAAIESLNKQFSYCEISFQDNGIGFEQEFAEKIFLIFHSLNGRGQFAGTGIGLAMCKTIAVNHDGEIFGISTKNNGALFKVLLPINHTGSYEKVT